MTTIDVDTLKASHRATWAAGDYAAAAELIDEVPPPHLLSRVGVEPGHSVLDVATGTGNVALRECLPPCAVATRRRRRTQAG
jgi:hypothetical protein